ncbi:bifunctional diaminohydroxyphosphoribosylaminopyrimidine deaminase/5-amino-6-(5-phosphoribosylamino)uracil reductase RibD [Helicobacter bizzozeronii]|uniref:bifunctional diaminohydroxyphosphoribosylaminopyrimidine deaminase/5-amino-6-(5-phosphoribosylamino)uracil reductase RibD n=1 Tax=Helicobacter bizzozeronii TaxID=56877 RepID=UPI000CED9A22|nr:bifunctional diaminohydroxyphosphoribosylaminopyrimidine deaminase/5-amino-6-(5-phosphoribosylamino)uracil reductase RibD [Helicobacter bizzozeronii]
MLEINQLCMRACVDRAWELQTLALPNPSVACMVLSGNDEVLALQAHQKANTPHAEVLALAQAFNALSPTPMPTSIDSLDCEETYHFLAQNHSGLFKDCTLFVTLEPCGHFGKTPPCAELLATIQPKCVVIGALEESQEARGGVACLEGVGIQVVQGVLKSACEDLLIPFKCLQSKGFFNLFKIAMRLDGSYGGKISGAKSQTFTHNQRGVANTLIISGQSVRTDRPTLDHRLADPLYQNKLCDVAILTRDTNPLDQSIPLFSVLGRCAWVCHSLEDLPLDRGFNLIEGGLGLLESLHDQIDMLLIHTHTALTPTDTPIQHTIHKNFTPRFTQIWDQDVLLWLS